MLSWRGPGITRAAYSRAVSLFFCRLRQRKTQMASAQAVTATRRAHEWRLERMMMEVMAVCLLEKGPPRQ
ncbi:hypothetical protein CXU21_10535 [Akkermansia muciniphila]|nr:hypothetical protein CXU21_10535 [Akkermansia muciniphila]